MSLGRYFITLRVLERCLLPYDYNYKLLKLIYNSIDNINAKKAEDLHENGFRGDNCKHYKLINPCLIFKNNILIDKGAKLSTGETIELMIGGHEEYINLFIKGIVQRKEIDLLNCKFKIDGLRKDTNIKFRRQMLYKVLTQVIESKWDCGVKYLNVYQQEFYEALANNLKNKYKLVYGDEYKDELYFDIENMLDVKKKKIQGIKDSFYKVGYGKFNIWIEANAKMQSVAYYCGLGQDNTLGAGTLIYLTSNN